MNKKTHPSHIILYIASALCLVLGALLLLWPWNNTTDKQLSQAPDDQSTQQQPTPKPPEGYDEWLKEGQKLEKEGNLRGALSAYLAATTNDPSQKDPYLLRSTIYVELKEYDKALGEVIHLMQQEPSSPDYQVRYASIRLHQVEDTSDTAIITDAKERLESIDPPTQESAFLLCLIATFQEHSQSTIDTCQKVPDQPSSRLSTLAKRFIDQEKAFTTFSDGDASYVNTLHAKVYSEIGFYRLAGAMLRSVIKTRPEYRDAWTLLGYTYLALGQNEQAKQALSQAYLVDTTRADIQYLLALSHDRLGEKEKAINFYTLALSNQYPQKDSIRTRLIALLKETEHYDKAVDLELQALSESSTSTATDYVDPIWMYIEMLHQPDKAEELARNVLDRFPDDAQSYNLMGWSLYAKEEYDKAKSYLEQSIQKDPSLQAAYYNLARVLEATQHKDEALQYYQMAYNIDNQSNIGSLSASAYNALLSLTQ